MRRSGDIYICFCCLHVLAFGNRNEAGGLGGVVGYSVVSYATDAGVGENNSMVTLGTRYRGR